MDGKAILSGSVSLILVLCERVIKECATLSGPEDAVQFRFLAEMECSMLYSSLRCIFAFLSHTPSGPSPGRRDASAKQLAHQYPWEWMLNTAFLGSYLTLTRLSNCLSCDSGDTAERQSTLRRLQELSTIIRHYSHLISGSSVSELSPFSDLPLVYAIAADNLRIVQANGVDVNDLPSYVESSASSRSSSFPFRLIEYIPSGADASFTFRSPFRDSDALSGSSNQRRPSDAAPEQLSRPPRGSEDVSPRNSEIPDGQGETSPTLPRAIRPLPSPPVRVNSLIPDLEPIAPLNLKPLVRVNSQPPTGSSENGDVKTHASIRPPLSLTVHDLAQLDQLPPTSGSITLVGSTPMTAEGGSFAHGPPMYRPSMFGDSEELEVRRSDWMYEKICTPYSSDV